MPGGTMGALGRQLERLFTTGVIAGLTEDQLLDRFISRRDEAAFAALVSRHGPMVLGVCRQLLRDPNDVDDAFQATFLILVRKAGSLRRRDLLGNWLYGVAYRVAVRSRAIAARRAANETTALDVDSLGTTREPPALLPELHEELLRLPESYRVAVVLCYLEGLTHDEAAQRLGWPIGTVKGRLARARELLRTRLTRRGLAPALGAIAIETLTRDARAAVPASLLQTTLKAASLVATGRLAAAGLISGQVVVLTEGVIHAMSFAKLKTLAVAIALAGSVVTGAGVFAYQGAGPQGDQPAKRPMTVAPTAASPSMDEQPAINKKQFQNLASQIKNWDERTVDQFIRWSRATEDAENAVNNMTDSRDNHPIHAATAHRDRMRWLHELTQGLSGPNQPQLADIARVASLQAQRDLDAWVQEGLAGVVKDQEMQILRLGARVAERGGPTEGSPTKGEAKPSGRSVTVVEATPERVRPRSFPARLQKMPVAEGDAGGGAIAVDPLAHARENAARVSIATLGPLIAGEDKSPRTKMILTKLEEPVSMSFAEETPLEDVLKYIKSATTGANDTGIPIYVDPVGLEEVDKTMKTPVTIDLEGVALKTTLRLLLKQIGLAYCVKDGVLMISSAEGINQELLEAATPEQKQKGHMFEQ